MSFSSKNSFCTEIWLLLLLLQDVLTSVDSVLYLDTDTLVLRPVEDIWNHFQQFDVSQFASMSPEGEESSITWYPRFAQHPFVGKNGMNSGVMLMNLTRMRTFPWKENVIGAYQKYKSKITWGDQDLLNIVFHDHQGNLKKLLLLVIVSWQCFSHVVVLCGMMVKCLWDGIRTRVLAFNSMVFYYWTQQCVGVGK